MNWLLVNVAKHATRFPIGLAYISAILKENGYGVDIIDLSYPESDDCESLIKDRLRNSAIKVVGTGGLSKDYRAVKWLVDLVRSVRPDVKVVVGGGLVSSAPETSLRGIGFDYGVIGEGDITSVDLARCLSEGGDVRDVCGLVLRGPDGAPMRTAHRKDIEDIDTLPFPDYEGFRLERYLDAQAPVSKAWVQDDHPRMAPIIFSRACPFACTFCFHSIRRYRTRSLDHAFKEVDLLVERYGVRGLNINDDLFAVKKGQLEEFCRRIKPYNLYWNCQLRVEAVDLPTLEMMRDAGCYYVGYGIESVNAEVLKSMKKKITKEKIEAAVYNTYKAKVDCQGNFIFGDPAETREAANESLNWWVRHHGQLFSTVRIAVYPGTEIHKFALDKKIINDELEYLEKDCPEVNLTGMPDDYVNRHFSQMSLIGEYIPIPGQVRCLKIRGTDHGLEIDVRCPHCGDTTHFGNLPPREIRVVCRSCRGRFDIPFHNTVGRNIYAPVENDALSEAIKLIGDGSYKEAVWKLDKHISVRNLDPDAWMLLGMLMLRYSEYQRSFKAFSRSIILNSSSAAAQNNFGTYHASQGNLGWACLHFAAARLIDRTAQEPLYNLKAILSRIDAPLDAIPYLPPENSPRIEPQHLKSLMPALSFKPIHASEWPAMRASGSRSILFDIMKEAMESEKVEAPGTLQTATA